MGGAPQSGDHAQQCLQMSYGEKSISGISRWAWDELLSPVMETAGIVLEHAENQKVWNGLGFFWPASQVCCFQVWWRGREIFPYVRHRSDWQSIKLFWPEGLEKALNTAEYLQPPQQPCKAEVYRKCMQFRMSNERLCSVHLERSLSYGVLDCVVPASFIWSHQKQWA